MKTFFRIAIRTAQRNLRHGVSLIVPYVVAGRLFLFEYDEIFFAAIRFWFSPIGFVKPIGAFIYLQSGELLQNCNEIVME